jgi:hypothetical protein
MKIKVDFLKIFKLENLAENREKKRFIEINDKVFPNNFHSRFQVLIHFPILKSSVSQNLWQLWLFE